MGNAIKGSIRARLNWHVNQPHTLANINSGTLSALRQSIASLVGQSQGDAVATNRLIDQLTIEYFPDTHPIRSPQAKQFLTMTERQEMSKHALPLNIKNNTNPVITPFKKHLKNMHWVAKQSYLSMHTANMPNNKRKHMSTENNVLDVVTQRPGLTAREIAECLFGPGALQPRVNPALVNLCNKGQISRTEHPYRYFPCNAGGGTMASCASIGHAFPQTASAVTSRKSNEQSPGGDLSLSTLTGQLGGRPLFVISCCKKKQGGGNVTPCPPPLFKISDLMMSECRINALLRAQGTINPAGVEFGAPNPSPALYLPAWKRYYGHLYADVPGIKTLLSSSKNVMIMSALYGLVWAQDLIQDYNLEMKSVKEIWNPVLPSMLDSEVRNQKFTSIVGLLPRGTAYADVFRELKVITPHIPSYLVSTVGNGATHILQGLAHALLYLSSDNSVPSTFQYFIEII